jgi:hypothetical protein
MIRVYSSVMSTHSGIWTQTRAKCELYISLKLSVLRNVPIHSFKLEILFAGRYGSAMKSILSFLTMAAITARGASERLTG